MINVTMTKRELDCLIDSIEVDREIMEQLVREYGYDGPEDHNVVMLSLLDKLKRIRDFGQ